MKIKTQFVHLILLIVLIPLIGAISLPIYHYVTSPSRYLMKGYKEIRHLSETNLTDAEWDEIYEAIKGVPPNMQLAVYSDYSIVISNIPELKKGMEISPAELFLFINETSDQFDYQMLGHYGFMKKHVRDSKYFIISRVPSPGSERKGGMRYITPAFILIIIFEVFCILLIIRLSKTIFSSIQLLEVATQKIANGELDTQLELPKKSRDANEISSLAESLDKMRASLKDNQERRTKFIMGISHDLRTPVALIKGYSEAITDGVVSDMDSIKKSMSIVENKAEQLEVMINDLINYMKLNTTEWRQHLASVQIKPVLDDFASSAIEMSDVFKRSISSNISLEENTTIFMDKNLFTRALENILTNAIRYTKEGDSISINADQSNKDIQISISDTGIGISENDLAHIYDIFYRGTSSRREQGMGIGLSVVKTVIDSHGWDIDVKSTVGKGTSFIITIPLEKKS